MENFTDKQKAERLWNVILGNLNVVKKQAKELDAMMSQNPALFSEIFQNNEAELLKKELDNLHKLIFSIKSDKTGVILIPVED